MACEGPDIFDMLNRVDDIAADAVMESDFPSASQIVTRDRSAAMAYPTIAVSQIVGRTASAVESIKGLTAAEARTVLNVEDGADVTDASNVELAIATNLITTEGDLIKGNAAGTPVRHAVGTDNYVLVADSGTSGGLKWGHTSGIVAYELRYTTTHSGAGRTLYQEAVSGSANHHGVLAPWGGWVVAASWIVDYNASSSGQADLKVRKNTGSSWSDLLTISTGVVSVSDGNEYRSTAAVGTHAFSAGDVIGAQRLITAGTMTTDDMTCWIHVVYDTSF